MVQGDIVQLVRRTMGRYGMVAAGDMVVAAVSGGPDSLAMLHILWRLRQELGIRLHVAHLNHLLRGEESHADVGFVRRVAAELGLGCTTAEVDVAGVARTERLSLEDAGRRERYAFFRRVMEEVKGTRTALGHTRDDQAETVLMRLLRGAGTTGLAGILPVRGDGVIRPLIACSRWRVEGYCREQGLEPRLDATNERPVYMRNRIRLEVLPLLESYNPQVRDVLVNLAETMRAEDRLLNELASSAYGDVIRREGEGSLVVSPKTGTYPLALQRRLVRRAVADLAGRRLSPDFDQVEQVLGLLGEEPGRSVSLPGRIEARREHDAVILARSGVRSTVRYRYSLSVPGEVTVSEAGLKLSASIREGDGPTVTTGPGVAVFDAEKISAPLAVRNRRAGDRFHPAGAGGTKKLKDFFIDSRVPRRVRDRVPLLISEDEILWVVGYRTDERFQPGPGTRRFLVVESSGG